MRSDRRSILAAGLVAGAFGAHRAQGHQSGAQAGHSPGIATQPVISIFLWPGGAPGMPQDPPLEVVTERSADPLVADRAVLGIARPRMDVFRPVRPNGAAVVLFPGGGYRHVVIDKEGYEMARWLAERGFTAFVLFYRLPGDAWAAGPDVALSDAQRALRIVRRRHEEFGLDPARIAAMGFSAGGHLCADLGTRFAAATYEPVDEADGLSARPHCAAAIYPVVSMETGVAHVWSRERLLGADYSHALAAAHSPDKRVPADAPPFFILHAEDDEAVPVENALLLRAALKERSIPVETHLFARGGHGFGLRLAAGKPVETWPELWHAWARQTGLA